MAAALNNAANNPPFPTYRDRAGATNGREFPVGILYATRETITRIGPGKRERRRHFRLEIQAAGAPPMDQELDRLYLWAVKTLYGDAGLAAACDLFNEDGLEWEVFSGASDTAILAVDFEAVYRTDAADPSARFVA